MSLGLNLPQATLVPDLCPRLEKVTLPLLGKSVQVQLQEEIGTKAQTGIRLATIKKFRSVIATLVLLVFSVCLSIGESWVCSLRYRKHLRESEKIQST